MISALAGPPLARVFRTARVWRIVAAWCALAVVAAVGARSGGWSQGASHVLVEIYGAIVLPLASYALVGAILGPRSIQASTRQLTVFGAPPASSAAVAVAVAGAACACVAAVLGATIAGVAHGPGDPPALRDAVSSAYLGALGAVAYAGVFALGSAFGKRGEGRTVLLAVDWMLGSNDSVVALLTPRGHLRNVLGGAPPMDISQRGSSVALIALGVLCALAAIRRASRSG